MCANEYLAQDLKTDECELFRWRRIVVFAPCSNTGIKGTFHLIFFSQKRCL